MHSELTMGSLFDGIGGFPLAAVRNGIRPMWASEIEAFPIEVTKQRFPDMMHVGDITKLNGADLPPVDIITGGSPCQDLSVAGSRAGLAGARSGLFMEQVRVIKEMRAADIQRGRSIKHTALSTGEGQAGQGYPCVFAAGFCGESSKSARGIGYQEECAPTLKAVEKGPSVMCLNDQGGQVMDCTENITGTLRAQMHSHQSLILESNQEHARVRTDGISPTLPASMGMGGGYVPMLFENHGIDARYTGPHEVSPTISARCGTGGNNVPLVEEPPTAFCISGNIVDRKPHNGGNGLGINEEVAFSLTTADRHAVFSRQRVDVFAENEVASTESARQQKDATDLVIQPPADEEESCIPRGANLIRRLTPLECERLQGFPDGWTNIPGASDSARYKALGNSVAIPCVEYVMRGIATVLQSERRRQVWIVILIVAVDNRSAGI